MESSRCACSLREESVSERNKKEKMSKREIGGWIDKGPMKEKGEGREKQRWVCVCAYVCVCVREREREKTRRDGLVI